MLQSFRPRRMDDGRMAAAAVIRVPRRPVVMERWGGS
jgi:hypothetical protein